jgi:hypothetical protein
VWHNDTNTFQPGTSEWYFENAKESLVHTGDEISNDFTGLINDAKKDFAKFNNKLNKPIPSNISDQDRATQMIDRVRWVINAVVIGLGSTLLNFTMLIGNIFMMIAVNRWWANGNIILIFKTIYLFV